MGRGKIGKRKGGQREKDDTTRREEEKKTEKEKREGREKRIQTRRKHWKEEYKMIKKVEGYHG